MLWRKELVNIEKVEDINIYDGVLEDFEVEVDVEEAIATVEEEQIEDYPDEIEITVDVVLSKTYEEEIEKRAQKMIGERTNIEVEDIEDENV